MWSANLVEYAPSGEGTYNFTQREHYEFILVAIGDYTIILFCFIIIYVIGNTKKSFELLFLVIGGIINIISGIVELVYDINNDGNWATFVISVGMMLVGIILSVNFIFVLKT